MNTHHQKDGTMRIGIALPNTTTGTTGALMLDWARRAEERGFAFVSTIGRIPYPSYDSLTALAAVGAATSRIGLVTNAVLAPTYPTAVLAKISGTVAQLTGDRLTLGLGVGARESDYAAGERDWAGRGAVFDRQLAYLDAAWRGEPVEDGDFPGERRPVVPPGRPVPILIGGHGPRAVRRTARWAAGWTGAGGGPARAEPTVGQVRAAWREAGREGEPRLLGLAYFAADERHEAESDRYVRTYYAYAGDHGDTIARGVVRGRDQVRGIVRDFEAIGMTELTFTPTVARIEEVDRLADLVL
ncbi:LLM class flavin-dependent oxidoreductase [Streptomyces sp. NPDC050560]|uniref:LLM class flavin-dependent oxidoreductase n=1 Tax=Streptomyces sp. NPDC050560 TaxID=3365630 RepID=UPI0037AA2D99